MNQIEDNLLAISKCMFQDRNKWKYISTQQKEKWFFIINRNMSKKFPHLSQLLNDKKIDKSSALDLWYYYMLDKPYPNWFWSKSLKFDKSELDDKDFKLLFEKMGLNKEDDLIYLIQNYPDIIMEELKFYKTKNK
jgi:hypothetical protein